MLIDTDNKRITFRQSWIGNFQNCPERARISARHPELETEGDAAMAGTGAHEAIEKFLNGNIEWDDMPAYARNVAHTASVQGVTHKDGNVYPIVYNSFDGPTEMIDHAGRCTQAWQKDIWPWLNENNYVEGEQEVRFEYDHTVYRDWTIAHQGTIDHVPANGNTLIDWKTAARSYKQKDKQRWAVQPSAYAMAAAHGELGREFTLPLDFTYGVMVRLKTKLRAELVTVQRTQGHIDWYMNMCKRAVDMFLAFGLDNPWPTIDDGNWLCSNRWCSGYSMCRGKYITEDMDLFGWQR